MRFHIALHPGGKGFVALLRGSDRRILFRQLLVGRRSKVRRNAIQFRLRERAGAVLAELPVRFHLAAKLVDTDGLHQYLDARLVQIVAATVFVIDAHDGFDVGDEVLPRHESADLRPDDRGATQPAANQYAEAGLALCVLHQLQSDIVHLDRGAILGRPGDREFELARQIRELRMEGAPLAQYLGERTRIHDFIPRHTGVLVAGDAADATAGSLGGVHLHCRQIGQDIRRIFQLEPVELDVLARSEVAVTAVVLARDMREHAHLGGAQQTVGRSKAHHVGMYLHVHAVLQAQHAELVFRELAGQPAAHLVAVLRDALRDKLVIELIVAIHY